VSEEASNAMVVTTCHQRDGRRTASFSETMSMYQALAWVSFRDPQKAKNADQGSTAADRLYSEEKMSSGYHQLLQALKDKRIIAEGAKPEGDWEPIPSASWEDLLVAPSNPQHHSPYKRIRVSALDLLRCFPPSAVSPMTHDEIVVWCRAWINEGKGNGMDRAWDAFKALPEAQGLSRDDVFRPAWRDAKTKN